MVLRSLVLAMLLGASSVCAAEVPAQVAVYTEAQAVRGKQTYDRCCEALDAALPSKASRSCGAGARARSTS